MNKAVIIASYLRPELLQKCVDSVFLGSVLPDKLIIIHRDTDLLTALTAKQLQENHKHSLLTSENFIVASVSEVGHIPPIEKALKFVNEDITIILDDDTTVVEDWLHELTLPFNDPGVGVTGGSVIVPNFPFPNLKGKPGRISFYGKLWGNIGWILNGGVIEVDTVMEGNSAWRTNYLKKIEIAEIFKEDVSPLYGLFLTLTFKKAKFKVLYNPKAKIWHYNGVRDVSLQRSLERMSAFHKNYTYIALTLLPKYKLVLFTFWSILVGDKNSIGLLSFFYLLAIQKDKHIAEKLRYTLKGRLAALRLYVSEKF